MAAAVARWSPVIILTEIPAALQRPIASRASARGGSIIPTRPTKVRSPTRPVRSPVGSNVALGSSRVGDGQDAQPAGGEPIVLAEERLPLGLVERHGAVRREDGVLRSSSTPGAPFTKTRITSPLAVERRHEPALGLERHLGEAGELRAQALDVESRLRRERHERPFGGIADQDTVANLAVVAERDGDAAADGGRLRLRGPLRQDLTLRPVALARDAEPPTCEPQTRAPSSGSSSACRSCRSR